jgi:Asp/Glu/hydantoin racemase
MGKAPASPQDKQGMQAGSAASAAVPPASSRELLDFIALVLLALKEEVEDLQKVQSANAQAFADKLVELGRQLPGSPVMGEVVSLMQSDDLRSQRQQHVINAIRYVEDIIRDQAGRNWAPQLTNRAAGWGEGLIASQTLEQVRAHFQHYLLGNGDAALRNTAAQKKSEVELF